MSDASESGAPESQNIQEEIQSSAVPNHYVDAAINVAIVVLAVGFFFLSEEFAGIRSSEFDPGAALWPRAALMIVIFAGIVNLAKIYRQFEDDESISQVASARFAEGLQPIRDGVASASANQWKYVTSIVVMFIYLALLTPIGFLSSTPLFLFVFAWIAGYRSPVKLAVFSLTTTVLLFAGFKVVMNISLPNGSWIFREFTITVQQLIENLIP
jgi:preprotein translocase subunit Sec61beta